MCANENDFDDAANDDKKVKPVEHKVKVAADSQTVHFDQHFNGEEDDKDDIGHI